MNKENKKSKESGFFRNRAEAQLQKSLAENISVSKTLAYVAKVSAFAVIILFIYEFITDLIFTDLKTWTSYFIPVFIMAIISAIVAYFVFSRKQTLLYHNLNRENEERMLSEKALKESEEKLRSIMENSPDAIFFVNQQGECIYSNKAVTAMLGFTLEDMKNKTIADISHPNKLEENLKLFNQLYSEGKVFAETEFLKNDGNNIPVEMNAVLLPDGLIYTSCRDISERKQIEEKIKKNEKRLLQLNVDKDRFISILGHDLKNPFNNILGFSEILTDEIESLNKEDIKDIVKNINKSAQIINKLLEDILMWARAQQGKISFKPQNLNFKDICNNNLEIFIPNAIAKNITINCNPSDEINIYVDIDMLKTVMRNLVSNAIKFTNTGGTIYINAEQNSENVTISVSDNGIGIAPDDLKKLFDISEVMTTKGTAGETGTGLGLLLCKEFVEKHQGKIWIESEEGKGSDFKFTLPVFSRQLDAINN